MVFILISELLQWLENSLWATNIRQSLWWYPILEIIHITGIVLVAGGAILFDILLLKNTGSNALSNFAHYLLSWSLKGLIFVIPSGFLLFITNATALANDLTFHLKLILLAVAGLNGWLFHRYKIKDKMVIRTKTGVPVKLTAAISIVLWLSIIACGRLLAY